MALKNTQGAMGEEERDDWRESYKQDAPNIGQEWALAQDDSEIA
jgi:hypothetical protein